MQFTDFTPEELIGKTVLYDDYCGTRAVTKITRTTKTSFGIERNNMLFRLRNGNQRTSGFGASCKLITEERANELRRQWTLNRRAKEAKAAIENELKSGRPTLEQLEAACVALGLKFE